MLVQYELDRIRQQGPANIFKVEDLPKIQIQVAIGQLEKRVGTTTLKFGIGNITFAEHCVVMKDVTRPILGLLFMRHNSVVIASTNGLIYLPHLTTQAKNAAIEAGDQPQLVHLHDSITVLPKTTKQLRIC